MLTAHPVPPTDATSELLGRLLRYFDTGNTWRQELPMILWKLHHFSDDDEEPLIAELSRSYETTSKTPHMLAESTIKFFDSAASAAEHRQGLYGFVFSYSHMDVNAQGVVAPARSAFAMDASGMQYVLTHRRDAQTISAQSGPDLAACCNHFGRVVSGALRHLQKELLPQEPSH